jgi:hypothetical protein
MSVEMLGSPSHWPTVVPAESPVLKSMPPTVAVTSAAPSPAACAIVASCETVVETPVQT